MSVLDLVVIGGGPAGLAAAAYALHAQQSVALVAPDLGGKVSYPFALRNVPARDTVWGASLVREMEMRVRNHLDDLYRADVATIERCEDGTFSLALSDGDALTARAVILATGARPQRMYIPGEIEFWGRGVSFSAVSHAPFFHDKSVVVIGSGLRAISAVLALAPIAEQVYLVFGSKESVAGSPAAEKALNHPKVSVFHDWEVQSISGDEYVTGVDLIGSNGDTRSLAVEGVFIQFGLLPTSGLVRELVDLDSEGHVKINLRNETSLPGLFAAGDVSTVHAEQVPVSIGEGAKAALSAWEYLALGASTTPVR